MTLPREVSEAFLRFGVASETIAWADDLYRHLGPPVVDAISELVETRGLRAADLTPAHLDSIRPMLGERYLRANHGAWSRGSGSSAFWCDRTMSGTARGIVTPLGEVETGSTPFATRVAAAARQAAGPDQPPPRGLLLVSQNAHRGNQEGTLAFDLVPSDIEAALALNAASGRHHTLPGSIGETSGRVLAEPGLAILWEVQPNVYKPTADRNAPAKRAYRQLRQWPLVTAVAALAWLAEKRYRIFVLRGEGLRAAHEVNPEEPLSPEIERLHDRTFEAAVSGLGLRFLAESEPPPSLRSLAKVNLGRAFEDAGLGLLLREVGA